MGTPSANLVDLWWGVAYIYIYIYIYIYMSMSMSVSMYLHLYSRPATNLPGDRRDSCGLSAEAANITPTQRPK